MENPIKIDQRAAPIHKQPTPLISRAAPWRQHQFKRRGWYGRLTGRARRRVRDGGQIYRYHRRLTYRQRIDRVVR